MKFRFGTRVVQVAALLLTAGVSIAQVDVQVRPGLANTTEATKSRPAAGAVEAIWRKHTIDFRYRSDSQYFTCSQLGAQLDTILRAVGAQRELSTVTLCPEFFSGNIRATITLRSPVEATQENVRAATTFSASERLVAHVNNQTLPDTSSIEVILGQWRTVSLSAPAADCELVRAISKQILSRLAVRVVRGASGCVSTQVPLRLIVEVLLPIELDRSA